MSSYDLWDLLAGLLCGGLGAAALLACLLAPLLSAMLVGVRRVALPTMEEPKRVRAALAISSWLLSVLVAVWSAASAAGFYGGSGGYLLGAMSVAVAAGAWWLGAECVRGGAVVRPLALGVCLSCVLVTCARVMMPDPHVRVLDASATRYWFVERWVPTGTVMLLAGVSTIVASVTTVPAAKPLPEFESWWRRRAIVTTALGAAVYLGIVAALWAMSLPPIPMQAP